MEANELVRRIAQCAMSKHHTVIHEKDSVRVAFILGGLLENFLLVLDAVGLAVHVIVTAQAAVESGCAGRGFLA